MEKELLRKLGEETIYSAKGHFKACDIRRNLITITIWTCAIFNIVGLIGIHDCINKWISALSLFCTIALLIWNEGESKNYRAKHKDIAEQYLSLHKKIRSLYLIGTYEKSLIEKLSEEVSELDKCEKPEIPWFARILAKKAINKKDPETDNWFLKK